MALTLLERKPGLEIFIDLWLHWNDEFSDIAKLEDFLERIRPAYNEHLIREDIIFRWSDEHAYEEDFYLEGYFEESSPQEGTKRVEAEFQKYVS